MVARTSLQPISYGGMMKKRNVIDAKRYKTGCLILHNILRRKIPIRKRISFNAWQHAVSCLDESFFNVLTEVTWKLNGAHVSERKFKVYTGCGQRFSFLESLPSMSGTQNYVLIIQSNENFTVTKILLLASIAKLCFQDKMGKR